MTAMLRLFRQSDPGAELDHRVLAEGEISVGRDRDVDWSLPDPTRTLSRRHCRLAIQDGAVVLRDDSTNGVFFDDGARLPAKAPTPIALGRTLLLGAFMIRLEAPPKAAARTEAADETPAGPLLDAFCSGAQIDSSVLSAEDPVEVMRRLGAVYREMVQGLGRLVSERTRSKAEHGLEWTAVQALDNNPFRWAPPHRVSVDLLQSRQEGFLSSQAAVRASFDDVSDHQAGLAAGSQAAVEALLAELSPEVIAEALQGASLFLKKKKAEALWDEYIAAHAKASKRLAGNAGGAAFREAYAEGTSGPRRPD